MDEINGSTSDGFHTFDELYHHRTVLFLLLLNQIREMVWIPGHRPRCWKSRLHADGTMFDGFFIAGVDTPWGSATYHLKNKYWDEALVEARTHAPTFDGHTPEDTLTRLCRMLIGNEVHTHG